MRRYGGYKVLARQNAVKLAFCWSRVRPQFYELAQSGPAPIATEALVRIAALYWIESEISGRILAPSVRSTAVRCRGIPALAAREARAHRPEDQARRGDPLRPLALEGLRATSTMDSSRSTTTPPNARCASSRSDARTSSSPAPTAAPNTGVASLIETCKPSAVDPHTYLANIITRIVNGHPQSRLDELLPRAYPAATPLREVA